MSRERRFLVTRWDERVELEGDEAHHLLRVLRLGAGDEVVLFDGEGRAARAVVTGSSAETVSLELLGEEPSRESSLDLAAAVAVPKGDRMAVVVQKLTELGVARIVPLVTERGQMSSESIARALARWRRVGLEACKQSGRSRIPRIAEPSALPSLLAETGAATAIVMTHPGASPLEPRPGGRPTLALVGPEGGWSEAEIELATERGARLVGLGPRVLRTETAAIVVAALLQWTAGDLAY